ncbi:MAG: hypothetical protein AAFQ15_07835, partial [Pseudomonadota bacterium]
GNELIFSANTAAHGIELYRYDGQSVEMIADINRGSFSSSPQDLIVAGDALYFRATSFESGEEWYAYDGVDVGLIEDFGQRPFDIDFFNFDVL